MLKLNIKVTRYECVALLCALEKSVQLYQRMANDAERRRPEFQEKADARADLLRRLRHAVELAGGDS